VLKDPKGNSVPNGAPNGSGRFRGPTTAEYAALLRGTEMALQKGIDYIAILRLADTRQSDQQGMGTLNRSFEATLLRGSRGPIASWIPREWNARADYPCR
jgi:hypothetical protein